MVCSLKFLGTPGESCFWRVFLHRAQRGEADPINSGPKALVKSLTARCFFPIDDLPPPPSRQIAICSSDVFWYRENVLPPGRTHKPQAFPEITVRLATTGAEHFTDRAWPVSCTATRCNLLPRAFAIRRGALSRLPPTLWLISFPSKTEDGLVGKASKWARKNQKYRGPTLQINPGQRFVSGMNLQDLQPSSFPADPPACRSKRPGASRLHQKIRRFVAAITNIRTPSRLSGRPSPPATGWEFDRIQMGSIVSLFRPRLQFRQGK